MRRFFPFSAAILLVAGCSYDQQKPPSPEGARLAQERTATGTKATKLEARPMTYPPFAGEVSIWDIKVFDKKDEASGKRREWKFFTPLPQPKGEKAGTTDVLMRAWIISKDREVFLPQAPSYKAYGSFVTDWTIPKAGDYSIFVEYQPARPPEERFGQSTILEKEIARWDFQVLAPRNGNSEISVPKPPEEANSALNVKRNLFFSTSEKTNNGPRVALVLRAQPQAGQPLEIGFDVENTPGVSNHDFAALSPDGNEFVHFVGDMGRATFNQSGEWNLYLGYDLGGERYLAKGILRVSE